MSTEGRPLKRTEPPTCVAAFRVPARILDLIDQAAHQGDRSRSRQLLRYVLEGLRRDGLLDAREAA